MRLPHEVRLPVSGAVLRGLGPLSVLLVGLLSACDARDGSPNLLEVSDLSPHSLEVADRLSLRGSGFPEGRAAKVSFRGDVFRAGQTPLRDVTILASAAASDPHSIAVTLTAELAREFCGAGDAVHATFRGATSVSFPARDESAPPVRGTLEGVVLDVNPASISKLAVQAHEAEATRFADYAGMAVVHSAERDVLLVDTVDPEGRVARAGLLPGDALLELDGVRLASLSDLIPPPRARLSRVSVRRGDAETPLTFAVDVAGFQPGSPSELAPAATLLGFAVALLLLFASPLGQALTWLEGRLASELRDRARPSALLRNRGELKPLGFARALLRELPTSPLPYFVLVMDSAWLTLLALNRTIWARELDLPVLLLGSLTALSGTALVLGGRAPGQRFSLFKGFKHVLLTLVFQTPVLAALACAVVLSGSLRSDDILSAQGGWPWQWFAFASPVALAILVLLVLGLVPLVSRAPGAVQAAVSDVRARSEYGRRVTLPEWSHLILTSGVVSLVFLGGPRVPGFALGPAPSTWLVLFGILLFQTKTVAVLSSVLMLRFSTNQVRVTEAARLGVRYVLPCMILLAISGYLWTLAGQSPVMAAAQVPLSYALCALCALCAAHVIFRVASQLARERPRSAINPWL